MQKEVGYVLGVTMMIDGKAEDDSMMLYLVLFKYL
jgi:hypothetical protein